MKVGTGYLKVNLFVGHHIAPVKDAPVLIKDEDGDILYKLTTDQNGLTEEVALHAPDKLPNNAHQHDETHKCFAVYDVEIPYIKGYKRVIVHHIQIFNGITSILPIQLHPEVSGVTPEDNIDEYWVPYEHGADENRGEPEHAEETDYYSSAMETVLTVNDVSIPEYITVHLGRPDNPNARNVRVPFVDYIKNVASSEIYPTWHESALYANIYAQISYALNRVYTVWYRSRGLNFDITNQTQFDQKFVEGREIFANIGAIVDDIFNRFLRRQGRREPFFASYCNGTTSQCSGMSQWGSQTLATQGMNALQILRHFYPNDIQIVESTRFTSEIFGAFRGTALREGSSGEAVRTMQTYLNRISGNFWMPTIPNPNGFFDAATREATMAFQGIFDLVPDGVIGRNTWYAITRIYVGVAELAALTSEGERIDVGDTPPNVVLRLQTPQLRGENVVKLQFLLNYISEFYEAVPFVIQNGVFRENTREGVIAFQREFNLTPDGVVGPATWRRLFDVFRNVQNTVPPTSPSPPNPQVPAPGSPPYPGTALRVGSSGSNVSLIQGRLNAIGRVYSVIPALNVDGRFGPITQSSVIAFQRLFGLSADGIIGPITWAKIMEVYSSLTIADLPSFPGTSLRVGSRGEDVRLMQRYLTAISRVFPVVPALTADGIFGPRTQASVIAFQSFFGLNADGVIGPITWDRIVYIYNTMPTTAAPSYPGTALRTGTRSESVRLIQSYLNEIRRRHPSIPSLTADGVFGPITQSAIIAFQRAFNLTADGIVGPITWANIVSAFNLMQLSPSATRTMSTAIAQKSNSGIDTCALLLALTLYNR